MYIQPDISPIQPEDFPRVVAVWEASVRATHHFVRETDIEIFRPLVWEALPHIPQLACVRDDGGQVAGFVAVEEGKVEMLFIHPEARGLGAGRQLLNYAIEIFHANALDVNEQNEQAVGFYLHMGFVVNGRSELDGMGKPYPLLHLQLSDKARST
ncbi:MAG: GNAT family N-acetyltransferase [Anaerolineae bacterium]|nr:GNAT family N-acetyltransferase [Anaerolineae bacterium]